MASTGRERLGRKRWEEHMVDAIREKLLRWALFGVIFALLPITFNFLSAVTRNQAIAVSSLASHGELLLISVSISAAAAGELFGREEGHMRSFRLFVVGMSFIIVCVASLWFADIASAVRTNEAINEGAVAVGSGIIFLSSIMTAGCCIALSELRP
jgi:uncharacterized membrane protein